MQVLVAIEPGLYRQVIGEAIRTLRPHVEVCVLEPDTLEDEVGRTEPDLVFASRPYSYRVPNKRTAWVEFLPYEHPPARICLAGRRWELETVGLDDLLSIVDETEKLVRTGGELGNC